MNRRKLILSMVVALGLSSCFLPKYNPEGRVFTAVVRMKNRPSLKIHSVSSYGIADGNRWDPAIGKFTEVRYYVFEGPDAEWRGMVDASDVISITKEYE